jgi:hypothetical protein
MLFSNINGVRFVDASSCDVVKINLAVGMSTQLIFEEVPVVTYNGDEQTFRVRSSEDVPRSIVITPTITSESLTQTMHQRGLRNESQVVSQLDRTYSTNLFVFFKNSNQLLFQLRFVDKSKADNIIRVRQHFKKDCNL